MIRVMTTFKNPIFKQKIMTTKKMGKTRRENERIIRVRRLANEDG